MVLFSHFHTRRLATPAPTNSRLNAFCPADQRLILAASPARKKIPLGHYWHPGTGLVLLTFILSLFCNCTVAKAVAALGLPTGKRGHRRDRAARRFAGGGNVRGPLLALFVIIAGSVTDARPRRLVLRLYCAGTKLIIYVTLVLLAVKQCSSI
jgi:hypothetical protein